jgi:hypothetical protein
MSSPITREIIITAKDGNYNLSQQNFDEWSKFGKFTLWDEEYGIAILELPIEQPIPQILLDTPWLSVEEGQEHDVRFDY